MTIPNEPSLSGSIVLERGTHFLSRQIIMHMAIYARMTNRKPIRYSHSETLIWSEQEKTLFTIGAREYGAEVSSLDYYGDSEILILKPKVPLTKSENQKMWAFYNYIDPTLYQVGNFAAWITWMKFPFIGWTGRRGDKKTYCYELSARFSRVTGRWPKGKSLDMVSVYDLYENTNYEEYKP